MTLNLKTANQSSCMMTLWHIMLHHHTKFGYRRFSSWGDIVQITFTGILSLFYVLDLDHNRAIQSFHKTIHLMMMCHQTKFTIPSLETKCSVVQNISSRQTFINISNLHCDLGLELKNPIFPRDTLAHNDASSHQVWLQKFQQLRRYHPNEHSLEFWAFPVTLTLTTTEQSIFFTRQPWLGAIKTNYFSCKSISSSEDIWESHLWWHDPSLWPWPWRQ